jgi:glycosyltransferase involved in cell wall biosynthesis
MNTISVVLISPFSSGPTRGNITTVRRIADNLPLTGCLVTVLPLDSMQPMKQRRLLRRIHPDLLHAFHAYHAGPAVRLAAMDLGIPYLVTVTGSDLFDPVYFNDLSTRQAIQDAAAVTCFDPLLARHLADAFPEVAGKITVVAQGVAPLPISDSFSRDDKFNVLLPAAIRPVKGITNAIDALTPLSETIPTMRLLLAGGNLDPAYSASIREKAASLSWVHMLGEVPHQKMGDLFAASDLVLNYSLFEGGMANTLLEAMIMGKPILVNDVLGNRSLIRHGETGWLYRNELELRELVSMLFLNPGVGVKIGESGRNFVQKHCSILAEISGYRVVYEKILGGYSELSCNHLT